MYIKPDFAALLTKGCHVPLQTKLTPQLLENTNNTANAAFFQQGADTTVIVAVILVIILILSITQMN